MNVDLLNRSESERLLLIFSGWATDSRLFAGLHIGGYDIMVVSDYRNFNPKGLAVETYKEICVVGWSFGVPHASEFLALNPHLPLTLTIAVNGTPFPVDNSLGIPEETFLGTLNNLNSRNLQKFYRRICCDSTTYNDIYKLFHDKDIESLKNELAAIGNRRFQKAGQYKWDIAIIGNNDRIIPPANQINVWKNNATAAIVNESHHFPDFQSIISHFLINKQLVALRFAKAIGSYTCNAVVQKEMTEVLAALMTHAMATAPERVIEFGAGNGYFTQQYLNRLTDSVPNLSLWDIANINPDLPGEHLITDAELQIKYEPSDSADIICGSATIQWFNNPLRFIRECSRVLRRKGILAFSTFTPDNFSEIRRYAGALPLMTAEKWEKELEKAGFRVTMTREKRTLTFEEPAKLLKHLKLTGVNALHTSGTQALTATKHIINENITSLTYSPVYIIASKI